jgi:hypothetical protein
VIVLVAIYILMNVACIGYFARAANRGGRRWNVPKMPKRHLPKPAYDGMHARLRELAASL